MIFLLKLSAVCETVFHYQDKIRPIDYVVDVALNMKVVPTPFVKTKFRQWKYYDLKTIKKLFPVFYSYVLFYIRCYIFKYIHMYKIYTHTYTCYVHTYISTHAYVSIYAYILWAKSYTQIYEYSTCMRL